ncbi:MAG: hypothetical protein Q8O41_04185 [Candidatus Methanoperedens sp.]|nr:hypothetical protein [Candidatus Methanoperedens sp.]
MNTDFTDDTDARGLKVSVKIRPIRVICVLCRGGSTFAYQSAKIAALCVLCELCGDL